MSYRSDLARFLAEDFERLGAPLLQRCSALDGHRLYLTGATGFFGKSLLALLALLYQRGVRFEVTALSRDPQRFLAQQPWCAKQPWLSLRAGDVREPWPGEGSHDLLLHAATDTVASAHINKQDVLDNLLASARQMVAFCERAGVRRMLLTGSGAQFGAIPNEWAATGIPDNAQIACDPTQPSSAYGEGKRLTELLAALHSQRHGTTIVYTRCFAFVGPGLALDGHFAIGNFIRDALVGRPIQLSSAGQALRSYLYSADLAVWLLLALLEASPGTRMNIGSDEGIRIQELAHRVQAILCRQGGAVKLGRSQPCEERSCYFPAVQQAKNLGLNVWTPLQLAIRRTAFWECNKFSRKDDFYGSKFPSSMGG